MVDDVSDGYRYADQWNELTLRPVGSKPYLTEDEARGRYEGRTGAFDVIPAAVVDSAVPPWSMRTLRDGAFVVQHYNREGSVTRVTGFREYDGRLFHDEVIDYLYPENPKRYDLFDAVMVITAYIKPAGTSKIITKDALTRETTVAEYRNVPVESYWAQRPAFGAWETLADPNFGDTGAA